MPEFSIKRGTTAIPLDVILSDTNGPIDLSGLTVQFKMRPSGSNVTKFDKPAIPHPDQVGNKGRVKYEWEDEDVDTAGNFLGEFKFLSGGKPLTVPGGNTYIRIEIGQGIDDIIPP